MFRFTTGLRKLATLDLQEEVFFQTDLEHVALISILRGTVKALAGI